MPFVPLPLLEIAVQNLKGKHPLAVLIVPAMVKAGVKVVNSPADGSAFGSDDELQVLRDYFSVPGAKADKPFRAVWEESDANKWRDTRYPGRSLQRMRTDRVRELKGLTQQKDPGSKKDSWGLRPDCGAELQTVLGNSVVRVADLAIWYGRNQDVADLDELVAWFLSIFPLDKQNALVGTIYDNAISADYRNFPFAPDPLTQDDYAQAVGSTPAAPTVQGDFGSLVGRLEACLTSKGFRLPPGLVARVMGAWLRGDIVVLVGQPGTGKTKFAQLLSECLKAEFEELRSVWVAVRPDFDESEMVGYERLDGKPYLRDFAQRVLQSDEPLGPHLVVLEEFNLAAVETYLGSVLIATQDPERRVALPAGLAAQLPPDTFILATCNSYLDEPETRLRVSFPTKRRTSIITMPNVLFDQYQAGGNQAVLDQALALIQLERGSIERRAQLSLSASFDTLRLAALQTVTTLDDLAVEARDALAAIAKALLDSPEGREFFTLGLLRDVALNIALTRRDKDSELEALGQAVADKIVHQLRGPTARADELLNACANLPNRDEIARLLERAKSGLGDQLLPLL